MIIVASRWRAVYNYYAFIIRGSYHRTDYAKQVSFSWSASAVTKMSSSAIRSVGPFQAELFFLKNTKSKIEIVKLVEQKRRKQILADYAGIKLYRDGFKVRPYGEEGTGFDWIGLNERAVRSPGGVAAEGPWRVRANQLIGAVRISKEGNPNLMDMANREGLVPNDSYRAFISMLEQIINTFEGDRQYVLREYAGWLRMKENECSTTRKIVESVSKEPHDQKKPPFKELENGVKTTPREEPEVAEDSSYSQKEYQEAVRDLQKENERKDRALKTMMLYGSAGVMTSTFSHEISRIATNTGSRMQQLRYTVKRLVGEAGYTGSRVNNPFLIIDESEKIDALLESWLNVIMSGVEQSNFEIKKINIFYTTKKILEAWKPLFRQKVIQIAPIKMIGQTDLCVCPISEVDLHIILNNFLLNSAWFLEKASVEREVRITIEDEPQRVVLSLENNGPPLDKMFANNPERIFDPGETSKMKEDGEGTGLGLWITKNVVDDASGEIHPMDKTEGFGLRITLPK